MPLPVLGVDQMRRWEEATWKSGISQQEVIFQAGRAVARQILSFTKLEDVILVICGKGHNGDDARIAGSLLPGRVVLFLEAQNPKQALTELSKFSTQRLDCIVDGIFGIGLDREVTGEWKSFIEAINGLHRKAIAVDVPSGLNASTGEPMGTAIVADITVTLGTPKRGLLHPGALRYVGRLVVEPEIGLIPCPESSEWLCNEASDFTNFPPPRSPSSHKGSFGHAVLVAGSVGYHGASVLSSLGACRAQPGLVTLITSPEVYGPVASQLDSVMVQPFGTFNHVPETASALLIGPGLLGPGLSQEMKQFARTLWEESLLPVIADASALDWIGSPKHGGLRVITPHPGEAARLLGMESLAVQEDRPGTVKKLSEKFGNCWVVLKGHQTLIGRSEGNLVINSSGNPGLAQGGSGDVLAGFLTGLLAQKNLQGDVQQLLSYGVWKHGDVADRLSATHAHWTMKEFLEWQ